MPMRQAYLSRGASPGLSLHGEGACVEPLRLRSPPPPNTEHAGGRPSASTTPSRPCTGLCALVPTQRPVPLQPTNVTGNAPVGRRQAVFRACRSAADTRSGEALSQGRLTRGDRAQRGLQPPEEIERSDPLTERPDRVPGRTRAERAKRRPERSEVRQMEERSDDQESSPPKAAPLQPPASTSPKTDPDHPGGIASPDPCLAMIRLSRLPPGTRVPRVVLRITSRSHGPILFGHGGCSPTTAV